MTEFSSSIFSKTPFFQNNTPNLLQNVLIKPTAKLDAMVSALVLSKLPFPSCVMAQKPDKYFQKLLFLKKLALIFFGFYISYPTKIYRFHRSFCAGIILASAPEKPKEFKPFFCKVATIFLLIKPA